MCFRYFFTIYFIVFVNTWTSSFFSSHYLFSLLSFVSGLSVGASAFAGSASAFAGSASAFAGSASAFAGSASAFAGSASAFAGSASAFAGYASAFAGSASAFAGSASAAFSSFFSSLGLLALSKRSKIIGFTCSLASFSSSYT